MVSKRKPEKVCHSVEEASQLIKHLANANRLAVICYLMEAPRSVTELEEDLGIPQPTLSQQLTHLREAGLITGQRSARNVTYRLEDARILPVVQALRLVFSELHDIRMQRRGLTGHNEQGAGMPDMFD